MNVVKPNLEGVTLHKDCRYMVNTGTKNKKGLSPIYPLDELRMAKNDKLKEFFPVWKEAAPVKTVAEAFAPAPELAGGSLEEPVQIEEVTVEIPAAPVKETPAPAPEQKPVAEKKESPREQAQRVLAKNKK